MIRWRKTSGPGQAWETEAAGAGGGRKNRTSARNSSAEDWKRAKEGTGVLKKAETDVGKKADVGEAGRCIHWQVVLCSLCCKTNHGISRTSLERSLLLSPSLPLAVTASLSLLHTLLRMQSILIAVNKGTIRHQALVAVCVEACAVLGREFRLETYLGVWPAVSGA